MRRRSPGSRSRVPTGVERYAPPSPAPRRPRAPRRPAHRPVRTWASGRARRPPHRPPRGPAPPPAGAGAPGHADQRLPGEVGEVGERQPRRAARERVPRPGHQDQLLDQDRLGRHGGGQGRRVGGFVGVRESQIDVARRDGRDTERRLMGRHCQLHVGVGAAEGGQDGRRQMDAGRLEGAHTQPAAGEPCEPEPREPRQFVPCRARSISSSTRRAWPTSSSPASVGRAPRWRRTSRATPASRAFTGVAAGMVAMPDADFTVLVRNALTSRRAGVACAVGIAGGLLVHTALAVAGVAAVLAAVPALFRALQIVGGGYVLCLAHRAGTGAARRGR